MEVESLNIDLPKTVMIRDNLVLTGIYKLLVTRVVWLTKLRVSGVDQANKTMHGGEHQAIYSFPLEHYTYWQTALQLKDKNLIVYL